MELVKIIKNKKYTNGYHGNHMQILYIDDLFDILIMPCIHPNAQSSINIILDYVFDQNREKYKMYK